MSEHRWGFEEADDWEDLAPARQARRPAAPEPQADEDGGLAGTDPDNVVTVVVEPDGAVVAVRLAERWRDAVDPRALQHNVRTAANNATMLALARQVETAPITPAQPAQPGGSPQDERPISMDDAQRLFDAVDRELRDFTTQLRPVADQRIVLESSGRHVTATALRGQLVDLVIDANWAAFARPAEIETELLDVLRRLHGMSAPPELAAGPRGSAIAELNALLADPQALLRRIGLLPAPSRRGEDQTT